MVTILVVVVVVVVASTSSSNSNSRIVIMYTVATTISTICGNYFTQHIPLHIPRRSLNKPKPIPDYLPD